MGPEVFVFVVTFQNTNDEMWRVQVVATDAGAAVGQAQAAYSSHGAFKRALTVECKGALARPMRAPQ